MGFDHVLVLCTGRCGSTTFAHAFRHCTNYTSGHETRSHLTGAARLAYPARHIEADNRLSWLLGRVEETFGDAAFYVHLKRDPDLVAQSFVKRADRGIMRAYRTDILMRTERLNKTDGPEDFAADYIRTVTANIDLFLKNKSNTMEFRCENGPDDTERLWRAIGAEGDLAAAKRSWETKYNAS